MTRAQELIKLIENASLKESLFDVLKWKEELAQYEEGNVWFDKQRERQKESLQQLHESIEKTLRAWPEA